MDIVIIYEGFEIKEELKREIESEIHEFFNYFKKLGTEEDSIIIKIKISENKSIGTFYYSSDDKKLITLDLTKELFENGSKLPDGIKVTEGLPLEEVRKRFRRQVIKHELGHLIFYKYILPQIGDDYFRFSSPLIEEIFSEFFADLTALFFEEDNFIERNPYKPKFIDSFRILIPNLSEYKRELEILEKLIINTTLQNEEVYARELKNLLESRTEDRVYLIEEEWEIAKLNSYLKKLLNYWFEFRRNPSDFASMILNKIFKESFASSWGNLRVAFFIEGERGETLDFEGKLVEEIWNNENFLNCERSFESFRVQIYEKLRKNLTVEEIVERGLLEEELKYYIEQNGIKEILRQIILSSSEKLLREEIIRITKEVYTLIKEFLKENEEKEKLMKNLYERIRRVDIFKYSFAIKGVIDFSHQVGGMIAREFYEKGITPLNVISNPQEYLRILENRFKEVFENVIRIVFSEYKSFYK